jgi:hypothetical protein
VAISKQKVLDLFLERRYPDFSHDQHSLSLRSLRNPPFEDSRRYSSNYCLPRFSTKPKRMLA